MERTVCERCARPVVKAPLVDGSGDVVLDRHEAAGGPDRFAVWDDGYAHPVVARASVLAYPLHRCAGPR